MPQKFAFTTAAMAAALEETDVSYEDLADIERAFDDAETDISELNLEASSCIIISDRSALPPAHLPASPPQLHNASATSIAMHNF